MDPSNLIKPFKIVILGDSTVGKTSIIQVVVTGKPAENTLTTVHAACSFKEYKVNGEVVKMSIWDTAGQERFRSLVPVYLRDCDVVLIVYAIDSRTSFDSVDEWRRLLEDHFSGGRMPSMILLGNKDDLAELRQVERRSGEDYAQFHDMLFDEVSTITVEGNRKILRIFSEVAAGLRIGEPITYSRISIVERPPEPQGCC